MPEKKTAGVSEQKGISRKIRNSIFSNKILYLYFLLYDFERNCKINYLLNEKFFYLEEQINQNYKMHKSPKYQSVQISSVKGRQKYFKNLYDEVNKSRMAVETITSFKNTEMNFKRKIDDIQQQLHSSMSRINHETKKNVILKELINLMKGQMLNFQKTQKIQEEKNQSEAQKRIKKIQYDVEQILQKHNQEVAKITSLKESANCGRSERVVFSNLFKKLEKQIKQNQEWYKQNLIKSEIAKDKAKSGKALARIFQKVGSDHQQENNRHSQTNIDVFPLESGFMSIQNNEGAFITLQRQKSYEGENFKRTQKRNNTVQNQNLHQNYDVKNTSRGFGEMISCYENFLQKIKVHIASNDVQQTMNYYETIELNNQNLADQIECYNDQISRFQKCIQDISMQKRKSECYENSKQLPLGSCRRIKVPTQTDQSQEQSFPYDVVQILSQLSSSLNFDAENRQIHEDNIKQLDLKLDLLLEQFKINDQMLSGDYSHNNRATTATSEGNILDILIEKMDRFSECQKLLDKHLFKQEYLKELGKNKKHKNKK